MLRTIELFAGIGAQRKALERANIEHKVIGISEIDPYAIKTYNTIYGETKNFGDISKIERLPQADLWTYSFPCTDISLAGKMQGLGKGSGTRSGLLWEVERLLKTAKEENTLPKYLLLENVKNLLSEAFAKDFNDWCGFLLSLGYNNFYKVLDSQNYGIPQHRERVFMISTLGGKPYSFPKTLPLEKTLSALLEKEVDGKYYLSAKMLKCLTDMTSKGNSAFKRGEHFSPLTKENKISYTITTKCGSRSFDPFIMEDTISLPEATKKGYSTDSVGDGCYINRPWQKRGVIQKSKIPTLKTSTNDVGAIVKKDDYVTIRRLTPRECWRLMGWNDKDIDLAFSSGCSETQYIKMAGNSIVVDVLVEIFKNLDL